MTPSEVLQFAREKGARQLDVRFVDIPGLQHHVSYPMTELSEASFHDGFGIDGSSIRGWTAINESDMLLLPDPDTAFMDPFMQTPTLVMTGDIRDPITKQNYERDPRWIARKAEMYLANSGSGDTAYFGAEAEFFIFDNIRFDQNAHCGFTLSMPRKGAGIPGARRTTSDTGPAIRKGIFRSRRPIIIRICARRW